MQLEEVCLVVDVGYHGAVVALVVIHCPPLSTIGALVGAGVSVVMTVAEIVQLELMTSGRQKDVDFARVAHEYSVFCVPVVEVGGNTPNRGVLLPISVIENSYHLITIYGEAIAVLF